MLYKTIDPTGKLEAFVECLWIVENSDPTPKIEKIIPDGFTEIIFHYSDPYRIRLDKNWELQSKSLLAGQIKKHFYLQNTGVSGMIGVKFKPAALTHLFDLDMHRFTDKVENLEHVLGNRFCPLEEKLQLTTNHDAMVSAVTSCLEGIITRTGYQKTYADMALELIGGKKGMLSVGEIAETLRISERQLERIFRKYVGLSPKLYARIIRFNYIFQLLRDGNPEWGDLAYRSGFYDQSHFIRNFLAFTGEDPSGFYFEEENFANFFLKRN